MIALRWAPELNATIGNGMKKGASACQLVSAVFIDRFSSKVRRTHLERARIFAIDFESQGAGNFSVFLASSAFSSEAGLAGFSIPGCTCSNFHVSSPADLQA